MESQKSYTRETQCVKAQNKNTSFYIYEVYEKHKVCGNKICLLNKSGKFKQL